VAVVRRPAALLGEETRGRLRLPPTERGEIEAFRGLVSGIEGGRTREVGDALCVGFEPTPGSAMMNRALGLTDASAAELDDVAAFFDEIGASYAVTVTPEARQLVRELDSRGYERGYAWTKFQRGDEPAAAVETDLRVVAADGADGAAFADVFSRAYGTPDVLRPVLERLPSIPGWHCFVAYDGDAPAATAAAFIAGDVAWFGVAGTLPDLRGRGAQSALLAARIEAAREAGCSVLVTETGAPSDGKPGPSYRNIVRAGFEPVYLRENYLSSPGADTSGTSE
jgi:GNAT superfamily N-acetyltransferase